MPASKTKPVGAPVWIELGAHDPDRQAEFYHDALGLEAREPSAEFGGYRMLTVGDEPVAGLMGVQPADPSGWFVYLRVDDLDGVLADDEVDVALPAMEIADLGRMAWITDPSGAMVGLWEARAFAGTAVEGEPGAPTWWELHVQDHFEATVAFYRRVLGWSPVTEVAEGGFRMATFGAADDAWAGIFDATGTHSSGWQVYFAVDDADGAAGRVASAGGTLLREPEDTPYGRFFEALDPEGSRFSVMRLPDPPE